MPGAGPETQYVEERVREPQDGAPVEVEERAPGHGRVDGLVHDGAADVVPGARGDGREDGAACERDHGGPVLRGGGGGRDGGDLTVGRSGVGMVAG